MKFFNQCCMGLSAALCMYFSWRLARVGSFGGTTLFGFFSLCLFLAIPKMKGRNQ